MSSFVIKIIAIISMVCDHSSDMLIGSLSFFNIIGRIAFPLFCFQLVVGYTKTKDIKKYLTRLLVFGVISQLPYSLFKYAYVGTFDTLNIFFTLAFGLFAIFLLDKLENKWVAMLIDIILVILAELMKVDYGGWGVCLILCIFIFFNGKHMEYQENNFLKPLRNNVLFAIIYLVLCVVLYFPHFALISWYKVVAEILGTYVPIIFMFLYNGKKGANAKYLFYVFYPIHLIILVALHYLI